MFTAVLLAVCSVCIPTRAFAQHYVGVRAGYGGGSPRLYPIIDSKTNWGMLHGGVSWKYYTGEKVLGGIEADLLFMQQGFAYGDRYMFSGSRFGGQPSDTTGRYELTVNSIVIPLMLQPHFYLFQQRLRIFLNAGVTFSYHIGGRYEVTSNLKGRYTGNGDQLGTHTLAKGKYTLERLRDNRWGYGLVGGGGITWSFGQWEIMSEVRYYMGYSDIWRNKNKYLHKDNRFLRSWMDNLQISVGAYYRLGKGGIISEQGRGAKAQQRALDRALRRQQEKGDTLTSGADSIAMPESAGDMPDNMHDNVSANVSANAHEEAHDEAHNTETVEPARTVLPDEAKLPEETEIPAP